MSMCTLRGSQLCFAVLLLNVIKVKEMGVSLPNLFNIVYCYPAWEFKRVLRWEAIQLN